MRAFPDEALAYMPFIANDPWVATSKLTPRTFTCLTIGSRGDVQPYIALALRLQKDGHHVVIVTHGELTDLSLAHDKASSSTGLRGMALSTDRRAVIRLP